MNPDAVMQPSPFVAAAPSGKAEPARSVDNPDRDAAFAQMYRVVSDMRRLYEQRNLALQDADRARHEALLLLTQAAEYRDDDTGSHIVRIGYFAEKLARVLGADPAWCRLLRLAAPMHDIGKIGIPDSILKKPGPLTPEEWETMRRHPEIGSSILGSAEAPVFQVAAEVAMNHHEKYDGSGYPRQLAGDVIPLPGRIVSLVDYFDALTMDRCYRKALPDTRVVEMIREQSGHHFDPAVVEAFLGNLDAFVELRTSINRRGAAFRELFDH